MGKAGGAVRGQVDDVLGKHVGAAAQPQRLDRVVGAGRRPLQLLGEPAEVLLADRPDQLGLVGEMQVDRGGADADRGGDRADRDGRLVALVERTSGVRNFGEDDIERLEDDFGRTN